MLRSPILLTLLVLATVGGCAHSRVYPEFLASDRPNATEAFAKLRLAAGPTRFSQVDDRLYRGGMPSRANLADLKALGVTTVVSLRTEDPIGTRSEAAAARALGLKFIHVPFAASSNVKPATVEKLMAAVSSVENGVVYVHCLLGRDRTSMVVALHLVKNRSWDPRVAWQKAALDFGHSPSWWYRNLTRTFSRETAGWRPAPTEVPTQSPVAVTPPSATST